MSRGMAARGIAAGWTAVTPHERATPDDNQAPRALRASRATEAADAPRPRREEHAATMPRRLLPASTLDEPSRSRELTRASDARGAPGRGLRSCRPAQGPPGRGRRRRARPPHRRAPTTWPVRGDLPPQATECLRRKCSCDAWKCTSRATRVGARGGADVVARTTSTTRVAPAEQRWLGRPSRSPRRRGRTARRSRRPGSSASARSSSTEPMT